MSYSIPIIISLIAVASLFLLFSRVFDKERGMIKTLFIMLSLGTCVLIAQTMRIIIDANATGDTLTNLRLMTTSALTISIIVFMFFFMYFFVIYTKNIIITLRNAKKRKRGDL